MMNAGQHGVRLSFLGNHIHERLGEGLVPTAALVEFGDGFAVSRVDILAQQFPSRMALPCIRRVIDRKARLEHRTRARSASASNRGVNDTNAGKLLLVCVKERVEGSCFTTRCPPGKDLQFRERKLNKFARPFILRIGGGIKVKATRKGIISGGNSNCVRQQSPFSWLGNGKYLAVTRE